MPHPTLPSDQAFPFMQGPEQRPFRSEQIPQGELTSAHGLAFSVPYLYTATPRIRLHGLARVGLVSLTFSFQRPQSYCAGSNHISKEVFKRKETPHNSVLDVVARQKRYAGGGTSTTTVATSIPSWKSEILSNPWGFSAVSFMQEVHKATTRPLYSSRTSVHGLE